MVLSMDRWVGKVAVVTGASSGIGAAIADQLVEEGLIVIGVARRSDLIEEHAKTLSEKKGKLHAFKADISKEEDVLKVFEWTTKNVGPVHILVNNAGTARRSTLTEGKTKDWMAVFDLNVLGLCVATREAVKIMKSNNVNGHIIHINSILGHNITMKSINVYGASKFAVTALTETLRQELNNLNLKIKITSISPGLVESEITTSKSDHTVKRKAIFENMPILKARDIADGVIYVLSTPQHVQVHELTIKPVGEKF